MISKHHRPPHDAAVPADTIDGLPHFGSRMLGLEDEYIAHMQHIDGDAAGRARAQDYLEHSTAIYKGEVIRIGFIPKLFDEQALVYLDAIQRMTYGILEKVIDHYMAHEPYRQLFGFSPQLDNLVRLPQGYDCKIPIGRFDLFLNEETGAFKFCEFNTDGSSAMNEDRESSDSVARSWTYQLFSGNHRVVAQELFDGWIDEFIDIYESYDARVDDPQMAIVDFDHSASHTEFDEFARRFNARGMRTRIVWMEELEYRDDTQAASAGLYTRDGVKIDVVYRRAVTAEIEDALEGRTTPQQQRGAQALVRAFELHQVCLIGSFRTQIAHCKQIFRALWHPSTMEFLTPQERAFVELHVPHTVFLTPDEADIDDIIARKDAWIIKPSDRYGSDSVYAGRDHDQAEWDRLVRSSIGSDHIAQEYVAQYATANCKPSPPGQPLQNWNNMIGYYNYGGRFAGLFNRAGQSGVIVGHAGGITVPTFLVDVDRQRLDELGLGALRTRIANIG